MFSIGEFARQGGVSPRMLRHYDALALLSPAHIAANGYRVYDEAQLPILLQIETLKSYGFALGEIGPLLSLPPEPLSQRIYARRCLHSAGTSYYTLYDTVSFSFAHGYRGAVLVAARR